MKRFGSALLTLVLVAGCGVGMIEDGEGDGAGIAASALSTAVVYRNVHPPGRSIHVAEVDLCAPGIELRSTNAADGSRTTLSFAARAGAMLAINGGHSDGRTPRGPTAHGGAFWGTDDAGDLGQAAFGDGLATLVHMHEAYAPATGHREVVSGLLTLVHDGVAQHAVLPNSSYTCSVQHPRTLLGLTADRRKVLMVVVDGRNPGAGRLGMTCGEAADYLVSLGAHWALNLDGGGSSTMVVDGRVVNSPSDGSLRSLPTHLGVVYNPGARGHCPEAPAAPPPPPPAPAGCGTLASGQSLAPGQGVLSCDGRFQFVHQGDGNVVLYQQGFPLWNSRTHGQATRALTMQGDGNLVLYSPTGKALWHTHTYGNPGASLTVQSDGNAVIYQGAHSLWATGTAVESAPAPAPAPADPAPAPAADPDPAPATPSPADPPAGCGALPSGAALGPYESVVSCDGRFHFVHQGDGNVVLYQGGVPLWSSRTSGRATTSLVMQGDGNLVLYGPSGVVWSTGTSAHPGASLAVQGDGNVVVYGGSAPLWHTHTCCR
ncbi:MAG TPA: phosphodiester glycosidase family protein [Myxococcales bacterium]|jgi:hypothetical protein